MIQSPNGIGGADLAFPAEGWPADLTVRLELCGLESLRIRCDTTAVAANVPSTRGSKVRLVRIDRNGAELPLDEATSLAIDPKPLDATGEPATPPIRRGGSFEFHIPRTIRDLVREHIH